MALTIQGQTLVAGEARGELLVADQPLSFWGGYDQESGEIIDRRHPLSGQIAKGKVLALPGSRGSSTTTAVMLESVRAGSAPAALLVTQRELFFSLASVVADEMYGHVVPVVQLASEEFNKLQSGWNAVVHEDGRVQIEEATS